MCRPLQDFCSLFWHFYSQQRVHFQQLNYFLNFGYKRKAFNKFASLKGVCVCASASWCIVGICPRKNSIFIRFFFLTCVHFVFWWLITTLAALMWEERHSRGSVSNNQAVHACWFRPRVGRPANFTQINSWEKENPQRCVIAVCIIVFLHRTYSEAVFFINIRQWLVDAPLLWPEIVLMICCWFLILLNCFLHRLTILIGPERHQICYFLKNAT